MPELLRSVIVRLCGAFGVHRARRRVRLPVSVSLAGAMPAGGALQSCAGYTCDVSGTGLSFVLPTARVGGRHIFSEGGVVLRVRLELPGGMVNLSASPVRYDSFGERGRDRGYLVGARILEISDRDLYFDFLRSPSRGSAATSEVKASSAASAAL